MGNSATAKTTEWKKIELSDRKLFENMGENADGIAMFGFASIFFWKGYYDTSYAVVNGNIVAKGISDSGECVLYFPRGITEGLRDTLDILKENCRGKLVLMPLNETLAYRIKKEVPSVDLKVIEGKCEYVYNQEDLANLIGKKYHSKRNHIAKFDKKYESEYINIDENNVDILRDCAKYMYNLIENSPKEEFDAIMCAIDNFSDLRMRACVIKVDGKYVAYSIGSSVNNEVADIHFEKADRNYEGSYAKVNNCFAKYAFSDKKFINREEDLGIEGLRKAKLSYYPCKMNQMYSIEL